MKVPTSLWISNGEGTDGYWAEGAKGSIDVELTDADDVRLGLRLDEEESDAVTIYVSRASADRLARFLAAAAVDDLRESWAS